MPSYAEHRPQGGRERFGGLALHRARRLAEAESRGDRVVISDVPLLFEVGLEGTFDGVIFVDAPEAVRLERLIRTRGLRPADATAMMQSQWPAAKKRAASTWVIDNDGTPAQLAARVADLWQTLATFEPTDVA